MKTIAKIFENNTLPTYTKPTYVNENNAKKTSQIPITSIVVNNKTNLNKKFFPYSRHLKSSDEIDSASTDEDLNNLSKKNEVDVTTARDVNINVVNEINKIKSETKIELNGENEMNQEFRNNDVIEDSHLILNENEKIGNFISRLDFDKNGFEKNEEHVKIKLHVDHLLNKHDFKTIDDHLNRNYNYKDNMINLKTNGAEKLILEKNALIENGIQISKVNI